MTRIEPLKEKRDLLMVTLKFSKQLVTDPWDRIYAVYSLVNDSKGIVMAPDYTLDTRAVYTSFARQLIEKDRHLDILHYVEMDDAEESTDVPSWVPDWRSKPHARSFGTENITRNIFSTSREKPTSFSFGPDETLILQGRKLGSLSSEGVLFPTDCHRDMHSCKDENLHWRELRLHTSLDEFFNKAQKLAKSCNFRAQDSPERLLCRIFSRDYYRVFKPVPNDLASAINLLRLYRSTVRDAKEVLRRRLATPENSWIRKRFYDLDSLRVRLWWLAHLSATMRNVEKPPDSAREGYAISMIFAANLRGNQMIKTSIGLLANAPRQTESETRSGSCTAAKRRLS